MSGPGGDADSRSGSGTGGEIGGGGQVGDRDGVLGRSIL